MTRNHSEGRRAGKVAQQWGTERQEEVQLLSNMPFVWSFFSRPITADGETHRCGIGSLAVTPTGRSL